MFCLCPCFSSIYCTAPRQLDTHEVMSSVDCQHSCIYPQVATRVSVPWSKAPMGLIKRQVEKGVTESCRESHKDWMEKAEQTLAEQPPSSPHSTKPPSPEQSVTHQQVCLLRAKKSAPWGCLGLAPHYETL